MKRAYQKPCIRKVDYNFQEQVTATSNPIGTKVQASPDLELCTHGNGDCFAVYNLSSLTRGINNCLIQG